MLCNTAKAYAWKDMMKVASHTLELPGAKGARLEFGIQQLFRDAANFLHMDVSHMKIIKAMLPAAVGRYAGLEA